MSEPLRNHIDGRWAPARSGKVVEREDPAGAGPPQALPDSDETDVAAAVAAARRAWEDWRRLLAAERAAVAARVPAELEARAGALAAALVRETGLTPGEAREEVARAARGVAAVAAEGLRHLGTGGPPLRPHSLVAGYRVPVGVCGLVTSGDGAVEGPAVQSAAALVCGNAVVLKPSEIAPAAATLVVEALLAAGVAPPVLNLVHGRGTRAGAPLVAHPDVRLVAFSGRTETGRAVAAAAAGDLKRVALRLGAQNAILVMDDADLEAAVAGALRAAFRRAGQSAAAASRIVLHRRIAESFTARFTEAARGLRTGRPGDPGVQVGPVWTRARLERVQALVQAARKDGAAVLCGGRRPEGLPEGGWFLAPTVLGGVGTAMRAAQEEVWGPVASLLVVDSLEEGIHVVNDSPYGLVASVYTADMQRALRLHADVIASAVVFNAPGTDIEVPWSLGGEKDSAYGRPGGTLDVFTEPRTVVFDYRGRREGAGFEG